MRIQITERQARQFNVMLATLKKIAKGYMTPAQIKRHSEKMYGLDAEETLEMSYENIQDDAASAMKGIKAINLTTK